MQAATFARSPFAGISFGTSWWVRSLARMLESWRYVPSRRDARLDMMRGFAALAMVVDHVGGISWLKPLTGGNEFLVSAAEVFVLISGLLLGIVAARSIARTGFRLIAEKTLHRSIKLYMLTVSLTLVFAVLGSVLNLWWRPVLEHGTPQFVFEVLTLQRTIFLVDIPLMYTLLLVSSVPALYLLAKGKVAFLLAASWGLWLTWQLSPATLNLPIRENTVFNIAPWQVIFITSLAFGYHLEKVETMFAALSVRAKFALLGTISVLAIALYVLQLTNLEVLRANSTVFTFAFDKANVPAGRLLGLVLYATFAYTALTLAWRPVEKVAGWLLIPLGRNSMMAYSLHLFVIAATTKLGMLLLADGASAAESTALQVASIALVWLGVRYIPTAQLYAARVARTLKATYVGRDYDREASRTESQSWTVPAA